MPSIRAFIALPSDPLVNSNIIEIQRDLSSAEADVRWEAENKLHITLKFLGDTEPATLKELHQTLLHELSGFHSLEFTYTKLGVFPNEANPRIVWVGTDNHPSLIELQSLVERVCQQSGFKKDDRPFHPHVTIGRVKGTRNIRLLTDRLKSITFEPIRSLCTGILIMQSQLQPSGSIYKVLKSFPSHDQTESSWQKPITKKQKSRH
jgi:2'-5' RNA ligase